MPVSISAKDLSPVTVVMRRVTTLPTVVTNASGVPIWRSPLLRGFEERRRLGAAGYFISDSILRKEEGRPLASVLRAHAPNVMIYEGKGGTTTLMKSPRCSRGGPPQVYVDGVALTGSIAGPQMVNGKWVVSGPQTAGFNLSTLDISDFAGVEWYPDNNGVPLEYGGTSSGCGALFLWTRER